MAEEPTSTMTKETEQEHVDYDDCKVFVSRIPTVFDEEAVKRLLQDKLGGSDEEEAVVNVALIYPQEEEEEEAEGDEKRDKEKPQQDKEKLQDKDKQQQDHRGFGYVTFDSHERQQEALALGTVRGGAKPTSTKKHTLYLAPIRRKNETQEGHDDDEPGVCFLWQNRKCPYGNDCKFAHTGEGACLPLPKKEDDATRKKRKKCFNYKKNKCKLGDDCPFSHDFTPATKPMEPRDDSQKDCLTWKKKGKCNKKETCPYRHDVEVQKQALEKKKRKGSNSQPLSVRVFGLNYDTTQQDVREYFQHCGPIMEVTFPTFEDSGRSKGYCGILFQSPKAVAKAVELDGKELHGRWLRVQAGKMYLRQWEEQHESRKRAASHEPQVGEFGQKVKQRKQHGFKE